MWPQPCRMSQRGSLLPGALFLSILPRSSPQGGSHPCPDCLDTNSSRLASRNKPRQCQKLGFLSETQTTGISRWLESVTSHFSVLQGARGGREGSAIAQICCALCLSIIFSASLPLVRSWSSCCRCQIQGSVFQRLHQQESCGCCECQELNWSSQGHQ